MVEIELENCVLCGGRIDVKKEEHIANRQYYIEGSGQLCWKCYHDVYVDSKQATKIAIISKDN